LNKYGLTAAQMLAEVQKRNLNVVTISWNFPASPLDDPAWRQQSVESARNAMKFLADFGANHLVVFSPSRTRAERARGGVQDAVRMLQPDWGGCRQHGVHRRAAQPHGADGADA